MKLKEKGAIIPPPILHGYAQAVSAKIQKWENIISATHWELYDRTRPDGADFYVGDEELGHIHLDGSVHLVTGTAVCAALLKNKLAKKFPWGDGAWILFDISTEADAAHALWLFRLNYDRINGVAPQLLLAEIERIAGLK